MRKLTFFILFLFVTLTTFAQNIPALGKAELSELLMKECAFEKTAGAMKLLDQQETEISIQYDLKIEINRRIRIKIFNKSGFDAANVIIPYVKRNRTSKVNDITAYIYNLDSSGNITTQKLEKKQILRGKSADGISKVAFSFPNVQPGSVIEYRFTHSEKNIMHLDPWFFQDELPTAISDCKFIYPKEVKFDFRFITVDSVTNKYSTNSVKITRTFTLNNIPSFRPEPMMSSVKDNLQRVEFAFLPRLGFFNFVRDTNPWGVFNFSLLNSYFFGLQMSTLISGTEAIIDSAKKIPEKADRINFVYQSVKKNIGWDNNQSFYADDLKEVWKLKSGNSAEINLTILNILKKSDVPCYPVLISTRGNGKTDPDFISMGQFNGVDVLILDSTDYYLLDGTQKHLSFKTTPYNILNRDVFIVDHRTSKWINISDPRILMKTQVTVKAELATSGELKGNGYTSYYEHSKVFRLEEQKDKKKDEEDDDKEFIQKDMLDVIIDSLREENAENELLPLKHQFTFTYKLSTTGEYYILDPFFLSRFRQNPFSDENRRTDIDMGSNQSFNVQLHITIPDNYVIEDLPKNILIRSNDSSMVFKREIFRENNILLFRNSFDILRPIYTKEEYPGIRAYFKKIYDAFTDQIVLRKKR